MSIKDLYRDSSMAPNQPEVEGLKVERNVILYGNVTTGQWEGLVQPHPKSTTAYSFESLSGGSQQINQAQDQATAASMRDALKVFVLGDGELGESRLGDSYEDALIHKAMAESDGAVAVLPQDDVVESEREALRERLRSRGVVVVRTLQDAADYANSRLL